MIKRLSKRLQKLEQGLKADLAAAYSDQELIHHLRVACRRAQAGLRWRGHKKQENAPLGKILKAIRRGAGKLRDDDQIVLRLQQLQPSKPSIEWGVIQGLAAAQRTAHEKKWRKKAKELLDDLIRCRRSWERSASKHKKITDRAIDKAWRQEFARYQKQFEGLVKKKAMNLDQTHALRVATKKLRYTLEFSKGRAASNSTRVLSWLTALQSSMGAIVDQQTFADWLSLLREHVSLSKSLHRFNWAPLIALLRKHLAQAKKKEQAALQRLLLKKPW